MSLARSSALALGWLAGVLPCLLLTSCSTQDTSAPVTATAPYAGNTPEATAASAGPATADFETPRKPEGKLAIMIITNGISPFWDPMAVGMKNAAREIGCDAEWSGPRDATVAEQKRMVEDALSKGADGIALSCIEAPASIPIIDLVLSKGVPIITFDSDSPDSRRLCYIGTNNVEAGKAAGKATAELVPGGGKFVGFVGNISAQNARERQQGFEEASKAGGIELLQVLDDGKDANRARTNVENVIAREGDKIQGLLGLFSYNGPAIAQAVVNAKLRDRYRIVCFDAEPVTLQELEKGNIDATVVQKPYQFGYLSTKLLHAINRKGWSRAKAELKIPDSGIVDTGVDVITPKNVRDYKAGLEKLGIKSS